MRPRLVAWLCAALAASAAMPRGARGAGARSFSHADALALLANRSIVFIGDSITRYQYLNLAHFLTTGAWRGPAPHNENEHAWASWTHFHEGTTRRLNTGATHEICDCHRVQDETDPSRILERRYFKHWSANASIAYLQLFGRNDMRGHSLAWLNGTCAHGPCVQAGCRAGHCAEADHPLHWTLADAPEGVVRGVIAALAPSILVVNGGYWHNYTDADTVASLLGAGRAAARAGVDLLVWKTTTADRDDSLRVHAKQVARLVPALVGSGHWRVFDAHAVTAAAKRAAARRGVPLAALYWDDKHFHPPVYAKINAQFLTFVEGHLTNGKA